MVILAVEYPGVDVWSVAAAAATALLGAGYAKLRSKGISAATAAARVDAELKNNGSSDGAGGDAARRGDTLLGTLLGGGRPGQSVLQLARGVFMGSADGRDLHHLDLLLRLMSEASARPGESSAAAMAIAAGGGSGGKTPIERRLNAHCGLVRRLLKAAPPGLDYKALVGEDPLADPLADPENVAAAAAAAGGGIPSAPSSTGSTGASTRTAAGRAAARARAMAELRSVTGLEHAPVLSKLATRIPGISGSAVFLAVAQRVLCGETGGLSPEALGLLRGDVGGGSGGGGGYNGEEVEAASASVYHLLSPLFQKMTPEDLTDAAIAVCAPCAAGGGNDLGHFPCRRGAAVGPGHATAVVALSARESGGTSPGRMEPLRLTVRSRRRVLDAASAAATQGGSASRGSGAVAAGDATAAAAAKTASAVLTRLKCLLDALSSLPTSGSGAGAGRALEMAWATANRAHYRGGDGTAGSRAESAAALVHRAILETAEAAADTLIAGSPPVAVDAVCSSMRSALGVEGAETAWATQAVHGRGRATELAAVDGAGEQEAVAEMLSPPRVYATATSKVLARLVSGVPQDRSLALEQLGAVCGAAGPGGGGGDEGGEAGARATAAKNKAWGVIAPMLGLFCREGEFGGSSEAAPALVLWARAEVLTVLRSFDSGGVSSSGDDRAEGLAVSEGVREGGSDENAPARHDGEEDEACGGGPAGSDGGSGSGGGGSGGRGSPSPLPLSVPFLRVAELTMEAFGMRVLPGDVDSWEARSAFLGKLVSAVALGDPFSSGKGHVSWFVGALTSYSKEDELAYTEYIIA